MKRFIDTNIFVYAATGEPKAKRSQMEIAAGGVISVQVLSEFANSMRTKFRRSWSDIDRALDFIREAVDDVISITPEIQRNGYELAKSGAVGIYDGLIIAAAQAAKCTELVTEDLQHGRRFGELVVRNPFRND